MIFNAPKFEALDFGDIYIKENRAVGMGPSCAVGFKVQDWLGGCAKMNLIRDQVKWRKIIYGLTDFLRAKLKPKGYSDERIAKLVAIKLKKSGYRQRTDIYALFSISFIREAKNLLFGDDIDIWVRWYLDFE